jgi:hypothetical protein
MPVVCDEYDLLFAHVPKTGGVFVERMLMEELGGRRVGGRHSSYRRTTITHPPSVRAFVVREPLSWYRSYWAYSQQTSNDRGAWPIWGPDRGNHPTRKLDRYGGHKTFAGFIEMVLREFPNGFVRTMYCEFMNGCTHAMRTADLTEDLERLLRLVQFDRPSVVRDRPMINQSVARWKEAATLPDDLARRIRDVDNLDGLVFPFVSG